VLQCESEFDAACGAYVRLAGPAARMHVAAWCGVLQCACSVLQSVCCSMLQCVAVCRSVLQSVAVCCSVILCGCALS